MERERFMPGDPEAGGPTPEETGEITTPPPTPETGDFIGPLPRGVKRDDLDRLGRLIGGTTDLPDPPHDPRTEKIISVRLPGYPTPIKVVCPIDPMEGLKRWRSLEGRLESEDASDKGSFGTEKQRLELLIGHFSDPNNDVEPKYREMARLMVEEEFARSNILEAWGIHRESTDYKGLAAAQDKVRGRSLNYLFSNDEFVECLNYLEKNAQKYWRSKPLEKSKLKEQMQVDLIIEKGFGTKEEKAAIGAYQAEGEIDSKIAALYERATTDPTVSVELNRLISIRQQYKNVLFKHAWAGMAEKVWLISLRGYMHIDLKESAPEWDMEGAGSAAVGARKLLRLKRWGRTQEASARPVTQLLAGFDMEATDFFSKQIVGKWFTEEEQKTVVTEKPLSKYDDVAAGERGYTINFKKIQERLKVTDPDRKVNFSSLADSDAAMKYHAYRNVTKPGDFMTALTDGNNSFLMNPNKDTLYALNDKFDYLEAGKWEAKKRILVNFIKYAKGERNKQTGKKRYTTDEIISIVNELTGLTDETKAPFIQKGERKKVLKESIFYIIDPDFFIKGRFATKLFFSFLLNLILETLKKGGNEDFK